MAEYYKGLVKQLTTETETFFWRQPVHWTGNEMKMTSISEIDATLDTSRFHISMPLAGTEPYVVDGRHYKAGVGEYFIFNPGQQARAEGVFEKNIKGICFFLTKETVEEVAWANNHALEKRLDSPFDYSGQQQEFMVKNYRLEENSFGRFLKNLGTKMQTVGFSALMDWDAFYLEMAEEYIKTQHQIGRHLQAIPSVKNLTRQEIYKRLSLAHCYILENYEKPFSLNDLTKIGLLSKYHLVRLYRCIYGVTPYQHLLQLRIDKAKELLRKNYSPTEVACQLSFSDRRAFSKVFKKIAGMPPSVFQRNEYS